MTRVLALTLLFLTAGSIAYAGCAPSPEIDASSATAAIGLLSGGFAILYSRKARQK
jgi:hypothetical protein